MSTTFGNARVTPWADWQEWLELKQLVQDGDIVEANRRLSIYLVRRKQAVPVALLTSIALAYQLQYPSVDEYTQRLSLSMTIVRFVNGMTDKLQSRAEGAYAKSVFSLAVALDLPLMLVEIRHQASHNNLPRLGTLQSAAQEALVWIQKHYWEAQEQQIGKETDDDGMADVMDVFSAGPLDASHLFDSSGGNNSHVGEKLGNVSGDALVNKLKSLHEQMVKHIAERKASDCEREEPIWELCKNPEQWKKTPVGLVPNQKRTPRWSTSVLGKRFPDDLQCDEMQDRSPRERNKENSPLGLSQRRKLNSADEEYVQDVMQQYYALLRTLQLPS